MELFQLINYEVTFLPQTMMLKPFAAIREKNKDDHDLTLAEMSFVWFYADIKSSFQNNLDERERMLEIANSIQGIPKDWEPSKEVLKAIDFYIEHSKTASSGLLDSSVRAVKFIENKLKNTEALLALEKNNGDPIYKLNDILTIVKTVPDVMEKLHKAKLQVLKEIEAESEAKGTKLKSMFEEGITKQRPLGDDGGE